MSSLLTSQTGVVMEDHSESDNSNLDLIDETNSFYQYMLPRDKGKQSLSPPPPPPPPPPPQEDESEIAATIADGTLRGVVRVEDWLMDVGAGYSEHLRRLQADKIKEELQAMQDRPTISDKAKKLTRGGVPVEERLMNVHYKRQRQAQLQAAKSESHATKADPECTHRPDINPESHYKMARYAKTDNKDRHQQLRDKLLEEEMRHVRDPIISEKSNKLAENRTKGMCVEDYLLYMDTKHKEDMYKRHELEASKGLQSQPNITRRAKSLKRSGDIGNRLYDQRLGGPADLHRLEQNDLSQETARNSRTDKGIILAFQDRGVNESYKPKINPDRHGLLEKRKNTKIEDRLYTEYHAIIESKQDELRRVEQKLQHEASTVHTSKHSQAIFKASKRSKSPLFSTRSTSKQPKNSSPTPQKPSKKISTASFNMKLAEWDDRRRKNEHSKKKLVAEKLNKEMAECTFDPFRSPSIRKNRNHTTSNQITEGTLQDRSSTWTTRRESKLNSAKESTAAAELDGCTFTPYINQEIPDMSTRGEAAYGYNEFITRLRKARTDKETEKKRVKEVFPSGDGWNGQQTVPKEFSLGQGGGKDIRSLKKPSIRDGFFRQQLNGSFEEKVTFSGFDVISDSETDHQLPYQAANGINLHTHPTAPSWTTGHIDGQSHREGSVDDFLSQQHSNVMAMVHKTPK